MSKTKQHRAVPPIKQLDLFRDYGHDRVCRQQCSGSDHRAAATASGLVLGALDSLLHAASATLRAAYPGILAYDFGWQHDSPTSAAALAAALLRMSDEARFMLRWYRRALDDETAYVELDTFPF